MSLNQVIKLLVIIILSIVAFVMVYSFLMSLFGSFPCS